MKYIYCVIFSLGFAFCDPIDLRKVVGDVNFLAPPNENFTALDICNSTENTGNDGFIAAFTSSITVILVSEIGDKTFFIAAILAMTNNKLVVFVGALSALYLMTILSALLGFAVTTFIPHEVTYYLCTAIMFLFGLLMLWDAWKMDSDEAEETQREVEKELGVLDREAVDTEEKEKGVVNQAFDSQEHESNEKGMKDKVIDFMKKNVLAKSKSQSDETKIEDEEKPAAKKNFIDRIFDEKCEKHCCFGTRCFSIFKLFFSCFSMTFIAEWGDRSQLATIVLAGINNVWGVIIGGCLGHTICTGAAVLVGMIVAKFISARVITFIGALVFIGFAIASIFIDPNANGIDIQGYDNCTRLINQTMSMDLTLELENMEMFG